MKFVKRFFAVVLILVLLLVIAAFAIPYFFKDQIVAQVKTELNNSVNATVDFADVDLGLLRNFPSISLRLDDLSIVGKENFDGVPLANIGSLDLELGFWSVVNSDEPIEVKSVEIVEPDLNILVRRDGTANYDIAIPSDAPIDPDAATVESPLIIDLQRYAITDGKLRYEDRAGDLLVIINDLDHEGSGNLSDTEYDLDTETAIDALSLTTGGVTYFNRAKAALDAVIHIDAANSVYTLKDNELTLNQLALRADGTVAMPGDDITMDLSFEAPRNSFKNLLSMIPSAYTESFDDVKANGDFAFNGTVKGVYNTTSLPAFNVNLNVADGDVKYPDLPVGISGINTKMTVTSPGGSNLDRMAIDIPEFRMQLGNNPIEGFFKLRTPISDPDVDAKLKGRIELAELAKAFPMEGVNALNGVIDSDLRIKAKYSDFEAGDYANLDMDGQLAVSNVIYEAVGLPKVNIETLQADFTPKAVTVNNFSTQLGSSDLSGSGRIDNILAAFGGGKQMTGAFDLQSNYFNIDEWMVEAETPAAAGTATTTSAPTEAEIEPVFDAYAFDYKLKAGKVKYDVYDLRNIEAEGNFQANTMKIDRMSGNLGKSDFRGKGEITNVMNYVTYNEKIGGKLSVESDFFDLTPFVYGEPGAAPAATTTTSTSTDASAVTPIPDYIDMTIAMQVKELLFDDIEMKNVRGGIILSDETASLDDMKASALGGTISMEGSYNTKDITAPAFDLKYNLSDLSWQETFQKFNTFQLLAPIGKFISGRMNTSLVMSGKLGEDLMPNLSTLSADGFLQTINGVLAEFPVLEGLEQKLNADLFKSVEIPNSKNYFTVANGLVTVKPFDFTFKDINMVVGGQHSLTNDMAYTIQAKIPRKLLTSNTVGAAADKGLGLLTSQASKLGINIAQSEFVNVRFDLGGSMLSPSVAMKLVGTDGESDLASSVVDDVKAQAQAKLDEGKAQIEARVQAERDSLEALANAKVDLARQRAKEEADKAKKMAEDEAKRKALELLTGTKSDSTSTDKPLDGLGKDVTKDVNKEVDKLKDKFKNPFGKKD